MKLTRACSYALHAVAFMAQQKAHDKPVASHDIAAARNIPERFLLKVLKPLVSARVLLSIKGPKGGYRLAKAPDKISMLEILEAVDGPIPNQAPSSTEHSGVLNHKLEAICRDAANAVKKQLEKVSVADLSGKAEKPSPSGVKSSARSVASAANRDEAWTEAKNQRRSDLIDRKYAGSLTPPDVIELAQLQEQMLRHRQRVAPLPLGDARRLHRELLTRVAAQPAVEV
jgi:Rrf2 family protein